MFYFFRKEQAPSVVSTPSNPLYLVENDNITLWRTYTLDGTPLDEVEVIFIPDSPSFSAQRVLRGLGVEAQLKWLMTSKIDSL